MAAPGVVLLLLASAATGEERWTGLKRRLVCHGAAFTKDIWVPLDGGTSRRLLGQCRPGVTGYFVSKAVPTRFIFSFILFISRCVHDSRLTERLATDPDSIWAAALSWAVEQTVVLNRPVQYCNVRGSVGVVRAISVAYSSTYWNPVRLTNCSSWSHLYPTFCPLWILWNRRCIY